MPALPLRGEQRNKKEMKNPKIKRCRKMNFFILIDPPTATAQEKKVRVVSGKPLSLSTVWLFPRGKSHKHGEWRVTKPDTDNLQKLLKDCMTRCGYWKDDAQVVRESVEKRWSDEPTGIYIEIASLRGRS